MPFKIKEFKFQHSRFLFTHYTFSKCFINQKRCDMDFNVVPPVVFNFWHELMNYERKRNRNSYLYYVIYEGPQLCSLLGEIRGLKRSQKTICSWAKKLYFSNSISTIPMNLYQNLLLVISTIHFTNFAIERQKPASTLSRIISTESTFWIFCTLNKV